MKTVISVIAILLALLLAGCTNTEAKTPQPSDTTEIAAKNETISEPIQTPKLTGEKEDYEDYLFDTPNSTCFSRIGYIEKSEILVVEFRESGSIYEYSGFTAVKQKTPVSSACARSSMRWAARWTRCWRSTGKSSRSIWRPTVNTAGSWKKTCNMSGEANFVYGSRFWCWWRLIYVCCCLVSLTHMSDT